MEEDWERQGERDEQGEAKGMTEKEKTVVGQKTSMEEGEGKGKG